VQTNVTSSTKFPLSAKLGNRHISMSLKKNLHCKNILTVWTEQEQEKMKLQLCKNFFSLIGLRCLAAKEIVKHEKNEKSNNQA
jgi:hypothetical protein